MREVALFCSRLALGLFLSVVASAAYSQTPIILASLAIGEPDDLKMGWDEAEPRADLKAGAAQFPVLDSSRKGDPLVSLRPAFETNLRRYDASRGL